VLDIFVLIQKIENVSDMNDFSWIRVLPFSGKKDE
jgi:hypothetical protein